MQSQNTGEQLVATDRLDHHADNPFQRQLASLMFTVRAQLPLQMVRVPHDSTHKPPTYPRAAYIALKWIDPHGHYRGIVSVDSAGRYWPENPPLSGPGIVDQYNTCDKLIDAINYHYDIQARVTSSGDAILTWDRASHGNTPAIILTPDDIVHTYYEAPLYVRELLDRDEKVRYSHPSPG